MTECEDCGEDTKRRTRCKRCKQLVCVWCYHHIHNPSLRTPVITARGKMHKREKIKRTCSGYAMKG